MDSLRQGSQVSGISRGVGGVAVLILGAIALYYTYQYLFTASGLASATLVTEAIPGNSKMDVMNIPPPYEGGEYSVSFWMYITAFKDVMAKNKHILEIVGPDTSTLVVGLSSFTSKLLVRVNTSGPTSSQGANKSLTTNNVKTMFTTTELPSGLTENLDLCDLPEVNLQKWVCVSIVLSGKVCDVYMDGKLNRSCVLPQYYLVDPKGVRMKLLDFGGFEGFLGDVAVYNYALNPDQIYRMYMMGPSDGQANFMGWIKNLFDVKGQLTYKYPTPAIQYAKGQVNFSA